MTAGRKVPLLASAACLFLLVITRLYSSGTCNGQQPFGIQEMQPEGAPTSRFGCIEGYTTFTGDILNALTVALPSCAVVMLLVALNKKSK